MINWRMEKGAKSERAEFLTFLLERAEGCGILNNVYGADMDLTAR